MTRSPLPTPPRSLEAGPERPHDLLLELGILAPAVDAVGSQAGCPSGQRERSVKPSAMPTLVRINPPPHHPARPPTSSTPGQGPSPSVPPHPAQAPLISLVASYSRRGSSGAPDLA